MPEPLPSPLGGPAPDEILLPRAPLVTVVAQVRFSTILNIGTLTGVTAFQDRIRSDYPLFEQLSAPQFQVQVSPAGPVLQPIQAQQLWRFADANEAVRLTLTTDTATFEGLRYDGRSSFLSRWSELLKALGEEFSPTLALRCGMRYVNRVSEPDALESLTDLIRPNMLGVAQPELRAHVTHALSEASLQVEEGQLKLRWGILPKDATIDPVLLPSVPEDSWILDIDVFSEQQDAFDGARLATSFRALSARAYALFRYAVTDDGLRYFGASI